MINKKIQIQTQNHPSIFLLIIYISHPRHMLCAFCIGRRRIGTERVAGGRQARQGKLHPTYLPTTISVYFVFVFVLVFCICVCIGICVFVLSLKEERESPSSWGPANLSTHNHKMYLCLYFVSVSVFISLFMGGQLICILNIYLYVNIQYK